MKKEAKKKKTGRPTKYNPKYCEEIIKFFDREAFTVVGTRENGTEVMAPCKLPTFEGFAISLGVNRDTINEWVKQHDDFSVAHKRAKDYQKEILMQNGLLGLYDKTFAIFTAKNVTDMSDKQEIDHQSSDGSMTPRITITKRIIGPKDGD